MTLKHTLLPILGISACLLLARCLLLPVHSNAVESQCYGTVSNGRIEGSVALPSSGPNFSAYSAIGTSAGRTYVHSKVAEVIVAAYDALHKVDPSMQFVYGETGWPSGGRFRPHRTHQNGLSVDFFVPVRDKAGKSVPIPTDVLTRFGYDIEFDADAHFGDYSLDFIALAAHLSQLHNAAKAREIGIKLVILDTPFLPRLFAAPGGLELQKTLPFMKGKPWVRHDEHYHVDFDIPCKPKEG